MKHFRQPPVHGMLLLTMVALASAACVRSGSNRSPGQPSPAISPQITKLSAPAALGTARAVLRGFAAQAYTFDVAEQKAGYHILRPSSDYVPSHGVTGLRYQRGAARPLSTTQYLYAPIAPDSIGVDVAPAYYWAPGFLQTGVPKTIGGRSGFMFEDHQDAYVFAFKCGQIDNHDLLCEVTAPGTLGKAGFAQFVASLR